MNRSSYLMQNFDLYRNSLNGKHYLDISQRIFATSISDSNINFQFRFSDLYFPRVWVDWVFFSHYTYRQCDYEFERHSRIFFMNCRVFCAGRQFFVKHRGEALCCGKTVIACVTNSASVHFYVMSSHLNHLEIHTSTRLRSWSRS